MTDFLITGCGRSGTGWAARLFFALGHPCTHEGQFNLARCGPLEGGESSWLAVPHLGRVASETRVLRIVRDPYEVVRSAVGKGFLLDPEEPYAAYAIQHCPDIGLSRNHLGRVIRWAALWDLPVAQRAGFIWRSEGPFPHAASAVAWATRTPPRHTSAFVAMDQLGTRVNTSRDSGRKRPSRAVIDRHPDGALIRERASSFGYVK